MLVFKNRVQKARPCKHIGQRWTQGTVRCEIQRRAMGPQLGCVLPDRASIARAGISSGLSSC